MDWGLIGWIVAVVIAVAAIVVTILVARHFGNRRAVLTWFSEATPLIPEVASHLEVTYRDIAVPDPVLLTVVMVNSGPRDISSGMFDNGKPIRVRVGAQFYGVTRTDGTARLTIPAIGTSAEDAVVELAPHLLRRRETRTFSAVVSGRPDLAVDSALVDTDVRELRSAAPGGSITSVLADTIVGVSDGMGGVLGAIASLFIGSRRSP